MGMFDSILGGDGPSAYVSPYTGDTDTAMRNGLYNRVGAKRNPDGTYDTSSIGQPVTTASAIQPYASDFSQFSGAMNQMNTPSKFTQTYTPAKLNYQAPTAASYNNAISQGSTAVNRQGASTLAQQNEAVGTRRPGLLLRGAEDNARTTGENLANLRTQLLGQKAAAGSAASQAEQEGNAGEQYKGYQSRASNEAATAADKLARAQGYGQMAGQQIGLKQGVTESAQNYADTGFNMLQNYLSEIIGSQNTAAAQGNSNRSDVMGFLGTMAKVGAGVAAAAA